MEFYYFNFLRKILIFHGKIASEIYNAIKEGGSTRILSHLMRVPASSYFFALSHLRKISITNLFLLLLLITWFSPPFTILDFRNKLSHTYLQFCLYISVQNA